MSHRQVRGRQRGFTLVELLVSIGVIVILMSLAVPMIGKAMQYANRTRCGSNLNQVGLGISMYTEHNPQNPRNYLPPEPNDSDWVRAVTNFIGDSSIDEVFACPARQYSTNSLCYSGHPRLLADSSTPHKMSQVTRPSGVLLAGDAPQVSKTAGAALLLTALASAADSKDSTQADKIVPTGTSVAFRHKYEGQAAANFLFADGHVEPLTTNSVRQKHVAFSY